MYFIKYKLVNNLTDAGTGKTVLTTFDYTITKEYDRKLKEKVSDFKTVTRTRRAIHLTMITTYSLKRNAYSAHVQSVVTAEDLFQPEDL